MRSRASVPIAENISAYRAVCAAVSFAFTIFRDYQKQRRIKNHLVQDLKVSLTVFGISAIIEE